MGEKAEKIFDIVTQKAGMNARMELSTKSGISKSKAREISDADERVNKLKSLASGLIGENIDSLL